MESLKRRGGKNRRLPPPLENQKQFFYRYMGVPFCFFFSMSGPFRYVFLLMGGGVLSPHTKISANAHEFILYHTIHLYYYDKKNIIWVAGKLWIRTFLKIIITWFRSCYAGESRVKWTNTFQVFSNFLCIKHILGIYTIKKVNIHFTFK